MIQFQENTRTDGRTEERKGRHTLFYRSLTAKWGGLKMHGIMPGSIIPTMNNYKRNGWREDPDNPKLY